MPEAERFIPGLDDMAVMRQPVEQRSGHLGIAKDTRPLGESQVGSDHYAGVLVDPKQFETFFRRWVSQIVPPRRYRGRWQGDPWLGHYLLMVKGNQPGLLEQVSDAFSEAKRADLPHFAHLDATHGRVVTQLTWTAPAALAAVNARDWPNCKTIALVASLRQMDGRTSDLEQRYYIASREMVIPPEAMATAIRAHWAVENKLHWMLDVNFSEDACTVRKVNATEILSLIRRVVINMLRLDTTQPSFTKKKLSKRLKRKFANWDEGIMRSILGLQPL